MTDTDATSADGQTWHWIITVQWAMSTGYGQRTIEGVATPPASMSRQDLYRDVLREVERITGQSDLGVMFFSLEPNQLAS